MWIILYITPGSHGCAGLTQDSQVLLTFYGINISTGWGRRLISVETSISLVWFIHGRLCHLMRSHWEQKGMGNLNFTINKPLHEGTSVNESEANLPTELKMQSWKRVSDPEKLNSPFMSVCPASGSFLPHCVCSPSASSVSSSSSAPFTYTARTNCLNAGIKHQNEKGLNGAVQHHLLSPLRLNLVLCRIWDFLCLKGQICLRVKWKQKNMTHGN